jgi:hypothetical protein
MFRHQITSTRTEGQSASTRAGAVLTTFSGHVAERFGARLLVTVGLTMMTVSLFALAAVPRSTPIWILAALMIPVGLAGPLIMAADCDPTPTRTQRWDITLRIVWLL